MHGEGLSLPEFHAGLHRALDAALGALLIQLVERERASALHTLRAFANAIDTHAPTEERWLVPLLTSRTPAVGPRRADHVVPEHRLLERLIGELDAALGVLPDTLSAADVVSVFPAALRLRNAFEHHTERELLLYGLLTPADEDSDAAAALRDSIDQAWPLGAVLR